jgi:hydroxymethylbilane synthase
VTRSAQEIRLGTRGSDLALWQARAVAARIAEAGGPPCRIVIVRTSGDRLQEAPLSEVGGKRLFVREIEDALLADEIDLAVHSSKDMPAVLPPGLGVAAVLPREDPLDAVVLPEAETRPFHTLDELVATLGQSPTFGTSSVRRVAQLVRLFSRARFVPMRGNVGTRLKKVDAGGCTALVLASAGLRRLGLGHRIAFGLPAAACVPAPGQGIVAVEIREDDEATRRVVEPIDDHVSHTALKAERALVEALGGGCQTPIGALASPDGEHLNLLAVVVATDGTRAVRASGRGRASEAATLGAEVAAQLLSEGASEILADVRRGNGTAGTLS